MGFGGTGSARRDAKEDLAHQARRQACGRSCHGHHCKLSSSGHWSGCDEFQSKRRSSNARRERSGESGAETAVTPLPVPTATSSRLMWRLSWGPGSSSAKPTPATVDKAIDLRVCKVCGRQAYAGRGQCYNKADVVC